MDERLVRRRNFRGEFSGVTASYAGETDLRARLAKDCF
jgi:hypothetical protein